MALVINCLVVQRWGHGSFIDVDLGLIFGQGRNQDHASWEAQSAKQKKEEEKDVAYAYNGMLFSQEREGNSAICNKGDGPWGHYAKWRKSDKDKYCMVSLVCVIHEGELLIKRKIIADRDWRVEGWKELCLWDKNFNR